MSGGGAARTRSLPTALGASTERACWEQGHLPSGRGGAGCGARGDDGLDAPSACWQQGRGCCASLFPTSCAHPRKGIMQHHPGGRARSRPQASIRDRASGESMFVPDRSGRLMRNCKAGTSRVSMPSSRNAVASMSTAYGTAHRYQANRGLVSSCERPPRPVPNYSQPRPGKNQVGWAAGAEAAAGRRNFPGPSRRYTLSPRPPTKPKQERQTNQQRRSGRSTWNSGTCWRAWD
jgi:hypothetical protein